MTPQQTITLIMPTIDWGQTCRVCLQAAAAGLAPEDQLLVVFDGPDAGLPPDWVLQTGATVLHTGLRSGPAAARNLAAQQAESAILLFVDADVALHPDAVSRLRARFAADSGLTALFGSYDDQPAAPGVVSRFRNLLHHHTHSSHPGPAITFWAGCGGVRREAFLQVEGFDAAGFDRPSIEDIEFGLRLSDSGHRIELDPAIQGTHHKRWTLRSMLTTDIRQRAIPWSQLLLQRRELPATLNLTPAARISAAASLLLPVSVASLAVAQFRTWALIGALLSLSLLLFLNRPFHSLLLRRRGVLEGCAGVGLHALYLAYSALTFAGVALAHALAQPLRAPAWVRAHPGRQRWLVLMGLGLVAGIAIAATANGLILGWRLSWADISQRFDEWRLFQQGIYPSADLASPEQRSLPYFTTSVYLPWALPLFGLFFAWGGLLQGKLLVHGLSLLSLALMARLGFTLLRPSGVPAARLGALAPLAIAANSNALAQGQFSIICLGLVSLQALCLRRDRSLAAGFCWALAMVKPQIALCFVLPLLARRHRRGLLLGVGLLSLLSGVALMHTHISPQAYLDSWLALLPKFIGNNNSNLSAGLLAFWNQASALQLWLVVVLGVLLAAVAAVVVWRWARRCRFNLSQAWGQNPLDIAGVAAIAGAVGFYHLYYDNIMMAPALLAALRLVFLYPRPPELLLAALTAITLWTPQRLLNALPAPELAQNLIWLLLALRLLVEVVQAQAAAAPVRPALRAPAVGHSHEP